MGLEDDPAEPFVPEDDALPDLDGLGEGLGEGLARGVTVIAGTVKTLPAGPGVYRMLNRKGDALYVGKARNLKRRVTNYTQIAKLPRRLQRMVAETTRMEIVTTHTEVEALLLDYIP
ncbi:MAG TPA: excinuclease ABC subunit C, partial [Alphaproteobacteria bacterium]|nr:excinuclease ABC subunit C [Alphaproteobacteria bacterium]